MTTDGVLARSVTAAVAKHTAITALTIGPAIASG